MASDAAVASGAARASDAGYASDATMASDAAMKPGALCKWAATTNGDISMVVYRTAKTTKVANGHDAYASVVASSARATYL